MLDPQICLRFLSTSAALTADVAAVLQEIGFEDLPRAAQRIRTLCRTAGETAAFSRILPTLLYACLEAADADVALMNLERYVLVVPDREELYRFLGDFPRAIEILVKLFVGSQYLTELLLRNPRYLEQLTNHRRLAEFKSREEFLAEGRQWLTWANDRSGRADELRRFQQWEILRIAACDTFGLLDFKTVTLQLSLLADAIVQLALDDVTKEFQLNNSNFTVLAFGKLGGEELNYSSDIDLVFVTQAQADRHWKPAQKLIRVLTEVTQHGFLYRVDMRLRPWGRSGPLVTTVDGYSDYLQRHGQHWEKQALLKARPIAGNLDLGAETLRRLEPHRRVTDHEAVRASIRNMKRSIEDELLRHGREWGEVKGGPGGIRDIEFLTQWLQLRHGGEFPDVHCPATLEGLAKLSDRELILPGEYRRLSNSYTFLRTIEHALQLLHNQQEHALPNHPRAQGYLARRLDYPDAASFVEHFNRHTAEVRKIFLAHLGDVQEREEKLPDEDAAATELGPVAQEFHALFSAADEQRGVELLKKLSARHPVRIATRELPLSDTELTVAGYDRPGELSILCGLLFSYGFDIQSGQVFTGGELRQFPTGNKTHKPARKFLNVFIVRRQTGQFARTAANVSPAAAPVWQEFQRELSQLLQLDEDDVLTRIQGKLIDRVARHTSSNAALRHELLPVEIEIDSTSDPAATILRIRSVDTPGFLYELTIALAMAGLSIVRMQIRTVGTQVQDELRVVNQHGDKITSEHDLSQFRATIVLIQHFIHLLPQAPNPESALAQFRELLRGLLTRPNWTTDLARLNNSEVLQALTQLLGGSEFLWQDFLRLQHENLFPVVTDIALLKSPKSRAELETELLSELSTAEPAQQTTILNEFKDREILRIDMRHLVGLQHQFGMFSRELTALAECVVQASWQLCQQELARTYGSPVGPAGIPARFAICALGKFGGEELGFASDIELMFIYSGTGQTTGPQVLSNDVYFHRVVEALRRMIHARQRRIFEIDLRLRPYGQAGNLAVSIEEFQRYFSHDGPAWPYERQALVKLRPIAGDAQLAQQVVQLRDSIIYCGQPFDVAAMRAMREKQLRQLVRSDVFNAKLSSGAVVDCEYLVQGLQITYGHLHSSLRHPNTREALKALEQHGILTPLDRRQLRDAYRFLRRLIDALRMVHGDATDLDVPPSHTDQFDFLARRLGYHDATALQTHLEQHTHRVRELSDRLLATIPREHH